MAEVPEVGSIEKHFSNVNDPRIERTKRFKLLDIILIAICGAICGADGWVDIEMFGKFVSWNRIGWAGAQPVIPLVVDCLISKLDFLFSR